MHDIRAIRDTPEAFDAALARRGPAPAIARHPRARRGAARLHPCGGNSTRRPQRRLQGGRRRQSPRRRGRIRPPARARRREKDGIARLEEEAKTKDASLRDLLATIPNLPAADVPDGADETGQCGAAPLGHAPAFDFAPREHYEIAGVKKPGLDFETAAKLSGARFVVMQGAVARLHRALAQFMLDTHTADHGLTEVNGPVLVRAETMFGTGQLPKFGEDSYETTNGWWLIPTSEVSLTNIVAGEILDEAELPKRLTAHSLCFRSEAGSAGRDTAGMLRQHQFEKVEMVSITHPDQSDAEQTRMLRCAETILEHLGIPYRTLVLCTGDMGFGARRTCDIRGAWLPGQNTYREISSVSTCGDFQARRTGRALPNHAARRSKRLSTLDGSGLAVDRCPSRGFTGKWPAGPGGLESLFRRCCMLSYMGGRTRITPEGNLA